MQVNSQNNIQQKPVTQPQYNSSYNCGDCAYQQTPQQPQQVQQQNALPNAYPQGYYVNQPQMRQAQCPQPQMPAPQPQNVQVPASMAGVNIQIFNPSVTPPGALPPTYNVNAPCYPSNYYTGQMGGQTASPAQTSTQTSSTTQTSNDNDKKKTEKRKIVQLTDDYIRNLENYLNSQDKNVRLSAAKEVYARLEEDDSRCDDKALNALVNKMLQDPCSEVRVLALSALDSRIATGDDFTVKVLTNMQASKDSYGMDAEDASKILLKMSGRQVEKEFPVKNDNKSGKTETKTETKTESSGNA